MITEEQTTNNKKIIINLNYCFNYNLIILTLRYYYVNNCVY